MVVPQVRSIGFLEERAKRQHQLRAEEARINAINQLLPKVPDDALVVQVGAGGYFVISTTRRTAYAGSTQGRNESAGSRRVFSSAD